MTQPSTPAGPSPQDGPAPTAPPTQHAAQQPPAPPWGTDDQFDPAKAWTLIQNLRGDVDKQKARVAELSPYEQRARELEDAQKTELQRANEALAAAQAERDAARIEAMRLKVATAKGIPAALIGRLQGATEQELAADADTLLAAFSQPQPATVASQHTPVEALRPASLPAVPPATLAEQIAAAEKAGDVREAIRLKQMIPREAPK